MSHRRNNWLSDLLTADQRTRGFWEMIAGALGVLLSIAGFMFGRGLSPKPRLIVFAVSAIIFGLSVWCFFTGWKNYAGAMLGASRMHGAIMDGDFINSRETLKLPVIEIESPEALKDFMVRHGKYILWLPCAKGGAWYERSAFLYTRWTLPASDVACPSGRPLIKYGALKDG